MTIDIIKQTLADTVMSLLDLKAMLNENADQDLINDKIKEMIEDIDHTLEGPRE